MVEESGSESGFSSSAAIELPLGAREAFDLLLDELALALERAGLELRPGPDGRLLEAGFEVGRVVAWVPGERVLFEWHSADWAPGEATEVELRLEPSGAGTRVVLEHRGWGRLLGGPGELAGWFAGELAAPLLAASAPRRLGDWVTDRGARRPSGTAARGAYGDPIYHYPNFRVLLEELALGTDDFLLEVGCGGGALLREALASGCRAAAVDHSADMVRLARRANREAVEAGRLDVRQASAERLPFADGVFTCATMTGVLGFLADPVAAFAEIRRVLAPGGRFVGLGSDPALRGTPAAPEPMASRLRFYDDDELRRLAEAAGFREVRVFRRNLGGFAREAGVPEEHLGLFDGAPAPFLVARKG